MIGQPIRLSLQEMEKNVFGYHRQVLSCSGE